MAKQGLGGYKLCIFSRRQELIHLSLLNNAKVKRNGNYGVALWKHIGTAEPRHSLRALPNEKTQPINPIFPCREDDRALNKSYSLFTSIVGSKMSNLSHHNSLPPHRSVSVTCSHNAADKMFRLPDSGMPQITITQPGGEIVY